MLLSYLTVFNIYNYIIKETMYPGGGELKYSSDNKGTVILRNLFLLCCIGLLFLCYYI